jgi:hypothetical protein
MIFMDSLKELQNHYERVMLRIKSYEEKNSLDSRQLRDYREWISLAGNLAEKIFDLENKEKFHGFDGERSNRMRQNAFGEWVNKIDTEKESKKKEIAEFRVN